MGCFQSFQLALNHQAHELNLAIGIDQTKRLAACHDFFNNLHGIISQFAIGRALDQWDLITSGDTTRCSTLYQSSWGIPCSHELSHLRDIDDHLSPNAINAQWHLLLPDTSPESYERLKARAKTEFDALIGLPENALSKVRIHTSMNISLLCFHISLFYVHIWVNNLSFFYDCLQILHQLQLLKTDRYALVSKDSPDVKTNNKGRPAGALNKGKGKAEPATTMKAIPSSFEKHLPKKRKPRARKSKQKKREKLTAAETKMMNSPHRKKSRYR